MILTAAGGAGDKMSGNRIRRFVEIALFLLFTTAIFQFPEHPGSGIDPSWKMAMGQTFHDGRQFGTEVVYNYGPLGFLMGNTSFGLQFWSLICWQFFAAMVFSAVIIRNGRDLRWELRVIYILMFLFYGITYPDALYMITIALMGIELIRNDKWSWPASAFFALFFAAISLMKFTNLVFALFVVIAVCIYRCQLRRWREALWLTACFLRKPAALVALSPKSAEFPRLPVELLADQHRLRGGDGHPGIAPCFMEGRGRPCAPRRLYASSHLPAAKQTPRTSLGRHPRGIHLSRLETRLRPRGCPHAGILRQRACPYRRISCPHGRPAASAMVAARSSFIRWSYFLLAIHNIMQEEEVEPPYVSAGLWESIHDNVASVLDWKSFRASYDVSLQENKEKSDLPLTRKIVGTGTVDLVGNEQTAIFYNGFHYSPRPVFQSFAAYNQPLEQLNYNFLASDRAPDFVLMKLNAIDERLAALDDALILRLLPQLYEVAIPDEHGYMLWKRRIPQQPSAPVSTMRSVDIGLNTPFPLGDLATKNLWVTIDLRPSHLARLRRFFYKPAMVGLTVRLDDGTLNTYITPLSQAHSGFILNPLIENNADYLAFSKGESTHRIRSLEIAATDAGQRFFNTPAHIEFSELPGANP